MTPARCAATGLVLTTALAVWWLAGVAECLRTGADPAALSDDLVATLLLTRLLAICIIGFSAMDDRPLWRSFGALSLLVVTPWPLLLLAQWSSRVSGLRVLCMELALLALCGISAALARVLARAAILKAVQPAAGATLAVIGASLLWLGRHAYLGWLLT